MLGMDETQRLIAELDRFLASSGLSQTAFSKKATNNSGFMTRLRKPGNSVSLKTAWKIRQFINAWPSESDAAKQAGRTLGVDVSSMMSADDAAQH
jgi:DNA-binding sugar fermentation-stimulating protein